MEGQGVGNTVATPVGRESGKRARSEAGEGFCRGEAITDGLSF